MLFQPLPDFRPTWAATPASFSHTCAPEPGSQQTSSHCPTRAVACGAGVSVFHWGGSGRERTDRIQAGISFARCPKPRSCGEDHESRPRATRGFISGWVLLGSVAKGALSPTSWEGLTQGAPSQVQCGRRKALPQSSESWSYSHCSPTLGLQLISHESLLGGPRVGFEWGRVTGRVG